MQQWDLDLIIRLQQAIRNPFLDYFFYIISFIGSEYLFLIITVVVYWCISKRFSYKFFNVFLMGSLLTGVFKTIVARPRPYTTGAQSVISETDGFSFPSGHSQSIANMTTQFSLAAYKTGNRKLIVRVTVTGAVAAFLVMFSRLYLGQHYLTDVLAGAALGVLSAVLFSSLFELLKNKEEWLFVAMLPISLVVAAVLIIIKINPGGLIELLGSAGAMSLGYFLEKRYVVYDVKSGALWKQVIKILAGILVIFLLKEGLSLFFNGCGVKGRLLVFTDFLIYFLMGIFASFLVPMVFKLVKL